VISRGGTILLTARSKEFATPEGVARAKGMADIFRLDALVVIGGDGSFRGARELHRLGLPVIGIPATIDNDIGCTNYCLGFDTAANTSIECIDKLRDTMQSHERCSVVEVMGRHAGYLAMYVGLAVGATAVLVPEHPLSNEELIEKIRKARLNGFTHYMIVVAEGAGSAAEIAEKIKESIDLDPRVTVLGHIQRGGTPSGRDRVNATKMGYLAVELLMEGKTNRVICTNGGRFIDVDIDEGLAMTRSIQNMEVDVLAAMTGI
jgi:6-phosphofructokinase 1